MIPSHKPAKWQRTLYRFGAKREWWAHNHGGWPRAWNYQEKVAPLLHAARISIPESETPRLVTAFQNTLSGAFTQRAVEAEDIPRIHAVLGVTVGHEEDSFSYNKRDELLALFHSSEPNYRDLFRHLIWWMWKPRSMSYFNDVLGRMNQNYQAFTTPDLSFRMRWTRPQLP